MGRPRKKPLPIEVEAQKFTEEKKATLPPPKPLTSRRQLAGLAMVALLLKSQGPVRKEDIRREAYEWADYMLEE